jgi:hypothetical protein
LLNFVMQDYIKLKPVEENNASMADEIEEVTE